MFPLIWREEMYNHIAIIEYQPAFLGLPLDAAPMAYVLWHQLMKYNPKKGRIDEREWVPCVRYRRAEVCDACSFEFNAVRAGRPQMDHAWIPDLKERSR